MSENQSILQLHDDVYHVDDLTPKLIRKFFRGVQKRKKYGATYFNTPCAFDIESSSFYYQGEKCAIMYHWTLGLNGWCITGRTWCEYIECVEKVRDALGLSKDRRLFVGSRNFAHEFQFMRHWFTWERIFALKEFQPVTALDSNGFEYHCTYILSGVSLERSAKELRDHKIQKLVGNLDYDLLRHSQTPLTDAELQYCLNDVKVDMCYIDELMRDRGGITKIPLTKTSFVREKVRKACFYDPNFKWQRVVYMRLMRALTMEALEFRIANEAFAGGFVHGSAHHRGRVLYDVDSKDLISSYPAIMVMELFPMTKGKHVEAPSKEDFNRYVELYCCIFRCRIKGLRAKVHYEHPLSKSRCRGVVGEVVDNGRLVSCDELYTSMTNVDYEIYGKFYEWDSFEVSDLYYYWRDYLPTPIVKQVISFYKKKTEYKDREGYEIEYQQAKSDANSVFGMCVTNPVREQIEYEDMWKSESDMTDLLEEIAGHRYDDDWVEKMVEKSNNNKNRFLSYLWGVFITAYGRSRILHTVLAMGDDYAYTDTDSVKYLHPEDHEDYFIKYNARVDRLMEEACEHHGIPIDDVRPKTIHGVVKPLGHFDDEGVMKRFKTLGAKRYLFEKQNGEIIATVAGISKKACVKWLCKNGRDPFEHFNFEMQVPAAETGKLTHSYLNDPMEGVITDYLGNTAEFHERSAVHLEPAPFSMRGIDNALNRIMGVKTVARLDT